MALPVLQVEGLEKELRTGAERFRLSVPSFSLHPGEVVGLSGKSGSGKSTFLDILALISMPTQAACLRFTAGSASHDLTLGAPEAALARLRSRHFGYVLQSGGLLGYLTVAENAALPFHLTGQAPDRARIRDLAGRLGLERLLDRRPADLSGGQRQRASVLRALVLRPAVVLCDEPTASVDEQTAEAILTELRSLALESGSATVLVSHDSDLLRKFSDRLCHLAARADGPGAVRAVLSLGAAA